MGLPVPSGCAKCLNRKSRTYKTDMFVVVPVITLLFYCATGTVTFLLTAHSCEIQLVGIVLTAVSVCIGFLTLRILAQLEKIEGLCKKWGDCDSCFCTSSCTSSCRSIGCEETRIVEEVDGRLVITTTLNPMDIEDKLLEMLETPEEKPPIEDTTEFADLLADQGDRKKDA